MLKVKEIAKRLECSTSLIYGILKRGELRHRIIGKKHIRIEEKDFEEYLEKATIKDNNEEIV